jgi:L-threonylcarbamoyladenylate synthase
VSEILTVSGPQRESSIEQAALRLRAGDPVVLPTDTVYGVAADAFRADGCARVFAVKKRGREFPLPVLLRSPKQLLGLCTAVPEVAERLMAAYWPGPLTMVVPSDPNLRWDLGDAQGTVAVRMPLDDVALAVIAAVGPLAVTSANLSGQPPATTAAEAYEQLGDDVPVYLDDGPRGGLKPSTIVDLTRAEPHVLRSGELDEDEILAVARGELDPTEASAPGVDETRP